MKSILEDPNEDKKLEYDNNSDSETDTTDESDSESPRPDILPFGKKNIDV